MSDFESDLIEIYNAATSEFARFTPGIFDFVISAWRPQMSQLEARKIIAGLAFIHDEFIQYEKIEHGNTDRNKRER